MARYTQAIPAGAKTVEELRRANTAEFNKVASAINNIPDVTSGTSFPSRPRLGQEFYLESDINAQVAGWYKYGPGSVGWVLIS